MKHYFIGKAHSLHIQFFRYLWVGATSSVIDLIVYTILVKWFYASYFLAAFLGYGAGLACNYLFALCWIFESRRSRSVEIISIIIIAVGGLLWTWLIIHLLVQYADSDEVIAKMISQVIVIVWNFGMRKLLVFK